MNLTISDAESMSAPLIIAPRTDPEWLRAYGERWAGSNPVRERIGALPVGGIYRFENLMPRWEFDRTEFYNEFFAPQRMNVALGTNTLRDGRSAAGLAFFRSWTDDRFDHSDERLLTTLEPHFRRAVVLNLRLTRLEMERDSTAEMLNRCDHGALLVDAECRILFANTAAEALLRDGAGLRVKDGRLAAALPAQTTELRRLIAGGGSPSGMLAVLGGDSRKVTALVLPLRAQTAWLQRRPAAIVFVKDPTASAPPSRERLQELFGLTPAQAALAREIVEGDGIEAAAGRLGIARSTGRTHLLEIFQKTGTSRQAELVRVILQHSLSARLARNSSD
jgi:DNA-binding CsgD family transcriptional regulator